MLLMNISVEFINLILICENDTVENILMDFLALVIISDFDEYYVASMQNDANYQLIVDDAEDILKKALKI